MIKQRNKKQNIIYRWDHCVLKAVTVARERQVTGLPEFLIWYTPFFHLTSNKRFKASIQWGCPPPSSATLILNFKNSCQNTVALAPYLNGDEEPCKITLSFTFKIMSVVDKGKEWAEQSLLLFILVSEDMQFAMHFKISTQVFRM